MAIDFLYPQYEVVRNPDRCIACRVCERQCANEVHRFDPERGVMSQMRQLPPLRVPVSDPGAENRQVRPYL